RARDAALDPERPVLRGIGIRGGPADPVVIAFDRVPLIAELRQNPPLDGDADTVGDDEMVDEEIPLDRGLRYRAGRRRAEFPVFRIVVDAEIRTCFVLDIGAVG